MSTKKEYRAPEADLNILNVEDVVLISGGGSEQNPYPFSLNNGHDIYSMGNNNDSFMN